MELSFLVIGAQKSGTTALYEYLREYPNIYLPAGKEVPFFSDNEYYRIGMDRFIADHFRDCPDNSLAGVITPQYMSNRVVADRVWRHCSSAKIVAILRDPVKRAISHYRMNVLRGLETRPINEAFRQCLLRSNYELARSLMPGEFSDPLCYVVWSEYGRILNFYSENYDRSQILILFFEDMIKNPGETIDEIARFVGAPAGHRSKMLGEPVFESNRVARLAPLRRRLRNTPLRKFWLRLPPRHRSLISYRFEKFSRAMGKRAEHGGTVAEDVLEAMQDHLKSDVERLGSIVGKTLPWERFSRSRDDV